MRMRRIFICDLSGSTTFFHIILNGTIFGGKNVTENKTCVVIFSTLSSEIFLSYSCQILIKLEFSRHIWEKYSNIKFNGNLSIGSQFVPCGETDGRTDGQMDRWTDRHDETNSRFS